jgi:hypothetical protein
VKQFGTLFQGFPTPFLESQRVLEKVYLLLLQQTGGIWHLHPFTGNFHCMPTDMLYLIKSQFDYLRYSLIGTILESITT